MVVSIGTLKSGGGDVDPSDPSGLMAILLRTVYILSGVMIIPLISLLRSVASGPVYYEPCT